MMATTQQAPLKRTVNTFVIIVFALLAGATLVALFVAQRVKRSPPPVTNVHFTESFSPLGIRRQAKLSFALTQPQAIEVGIVDPEGKLVRQLSNERQAPAYRRLHFNWDGRNSQGKTAGDGRYRVQVKLLDQGRTVVIPQSITLSMRRPRPVIASIDEFAGRGPMVLPPRETEIPVRFRGSAKFKPTFLIYRTDLPKPQYVGSFRGEVGSHTALWDGKVDGKPLSRGTYLLAIQVRNKAGIAGSEPAQLPPTGGKVRGRPWVIVSHKRIVSREGR
jgi:hypothetical protein